jgi:hypothetical protein
LRAHSTVPSARRIDSTQSSERCITGHIDSTNGVSRVHSQWCHTPVAMYAQTLVSSLASSTEPSGR